MLGKQWIVLVIVLGLVVLGNCQGKDKKKDKDKKVYVVTAQLAYTYASIILITILSIAYL